tara:strand:- start:5238 stop:5396 length:159 start_codon:yes stop_codon:yes gene_type:complete
MMVNLYPAFSKSFRIVLLSLVGQYHSVICSNLLRNYKGKIAFNKLASQQFSI